MISGTSNRCIFEFEGLLAAMNHEGPRKNVRRLSQFSDFLEEEAEELAEEARSQGEESPPPPVAAVESQPLLAAPPPPAPEVDIEKRLAALHPGYSKNLDDFLKILHRWT